MLPLSEQSSPLHPFKQMQYPFSKQVPPFLQEQDNEQFCPYVPSGQPVIMNAQKLMQLL